MVQYYAKVLIVSGRAGAFRPAPKVWSAIVQVNPTEPCHSRRAMKITWRCSCDRRSANVAKTPKCHQIVVKWKGKSVIWNRSGIRAERLGIADFIRLSDAALYWYIPAIE